MKHQKRPFFLLIILFVLLTFPATNHGTSAKSLDTPHFVADGEPLSLGVGDFFLTEDELPSPWIPYQRPYSPGQHMALRGKFMGGSQWAAVRVQDAEGASIGIFIGYFPTEADAIYYADPDTFISSTDVYTETVKTFAEVLQEENSQYSLTGGALYGDGGGFSGGYQHQEFQPFNVFRVGQVLFEVSGYIAGEGVFEPLLVNKARRLLNTVDATDETPPTADSVTPAVTDTPQQGAPIVVKASLEGYGEDTQRIDNSPNYEVIIIQGKVTDQEGNGVGGANVEVVSGADSAAISTNADGTYSLVVNVSGGQGNGNVGGVNFTLQLEGDLSVGKVELVQAVSGSELAFSKHTAALVFPRFSSKAESSVDTKITLYVNGQEFKTLPFRVKNQYSARDHHRVLDAVQFFIPPSFVRTGVFEVRAVIDPENTFVEPDETNNEKTFSQMVSPSKGLSLVMVALSPSISAGDAGAWASTAREFLAKTYPVPSVRIVPHPVYSNGWLNLAMALRDAAIVNNARVAYNEANPETRVEYAVGLYPPDEYGTGNRGFVYRHFYPKAPLVSIQFPITISHEIGHVYLGGYEEVDDDPDLGGVSLPEGYVYDHITGQVRHINPSSNWINFMGDPYAGHELGSVTVIPWVSPTAYNTILSARQIATEPTSKVATMAAPRWSAAAPFEQVLYLSGYFDNGELKLLPPQTLNTTEVGEYPAGEFTAAFQAGDGSVLAETSFGINHDLGEYDAPNPGGFQVEIPYPAEAARFVITKGEEEFYRLEKSPNPPTLSVDQPRGGNPVEGATTLTWAASDGDGDSLTHNVYYSPDGGTTWQLLAVGWTGSDLPVDASLLPGGDNALIRVTASDGLNTTHAESAPFVVPKHAPAVTILPPDAEAEPWVEGHPNLLAAAAEDVEDGLLSSTSLQWTSDKDGVLGQGNAFYIALSKGKHTITVTATDSDGQQASATTTINVSGISILPTINLSGNMLFLVGGGILVLLVGGVFLGVFALSRRRRQRQVRPQRPRRRPQASGQPGSVQDAQGRWWYQNPNTGAWSIWNGSAWQLAPQASPNIAAPKRASMKKQRGGGSCLFTLLISGLIGLVVIGGISLVAFQFFPGYQIQMGQGDLSEILKWEGGGFLLSVLALFMIRGGLKSIITRRAIVEDEVGRRREKRGCGAVLNGLGQLFFGTLLLIGGLGMMTLTFYQEVLPWLGF